MPQLQPWLQGFLQVQGIALQRHEPHCEAASGRAQEWSIKRASQCSSRENGAARTAAHAGAMSRIASNPAAEGLTNEIIPLHSLPQAWLQLLIHSHLDSAARVALLQTSHTLCHLVLSTAPNAKLKLNVSSGMWHCIDVHRTCLSLRQAECTGTFRIPQLDMTRSPGHYAMLRRLMASPDTSLGLDVRLGATLNVLSGTRA